MPDARELAQLVSNETGISTDIIFGQWNHETGGFSNWGATHANNYGGMKKFKDQPEWFTGDPKSPEGDDYQVFGSPEEYAQYYASYIKAYAPNALNAKTPEEYARALYGMGYYGNPNLTPEEDIQNYANGISSGMSSGSPFIPGGYISGDGFGARPTDIPTIEPIPLTFGDYMKNKWGQGFYDNGLVGLAREVWSGIGTTKQLNYIPSQEDYDRVTKALPNDPVAQRWVLLNAQNPEQLFNMIQMKQEDAQRQQRIQDYQGNLLTDIAGFGSAMVGGIMGDPLMLLPVIGQEALIVKAIGNLGTRTASMISASKLARMAEIGTQQAGLAVGSRYSAEKLAGFEQDYTSAGLMGFGAGFLLTGLSSMFKGRSPRLESTSKIIGAIDNMETHALSMSMGIEPPSTISKLREVFRNTHDPAFVVNQGSSVLSKLANDGKVMAVSKADVTPYAKTYGINMETTKAFHVPNENLTVLLKDALTTGDSIDGILAHEVGVHANLKATAGNDFGKIEQSVRARMANPDKSWLEAMKAVPKGGWEETLGHWMEKNISKKDPLTKQVKNLYSKVLGKGQEFTDAELKGFVRRSLQNEAERSQGYRLLDDGSVIHNDLQFSASNSFNPDLLDHMLDIEPSRGLGKRISDWTENGWLYRTPFGVLTTSPAKIAKEIASDLLEDARMRPRTGASPISIEKQKEHIRNNLQQHIEKFYDVRQKYMMDTLTTEGVPTSSRMQEFNRMVREYYNATYAGNRGGLVATDYPSAVKEASQAIKTLREEMIYTGKTSGDMFGMHESNLIHKDYKVIDDELWRKLDDQKWLRFTHKFPSIEAGKDFLRGYAERAMKRDVIRTRLEAKVKAEYEVKLAEWQEKVDKLAEGEKKPRRPANRKVTDKQVEKAVQDEAKEWAMGISDQNLSNIDRFVSNHTDELGNMMKHRAPMDTSIVMDTPWGEPFSYDISLRSDNLDEIMPRTLNRFAGEASLRNRYENTQAMNLERDELVKALDHGVKHQKIDAVSRKRTLEAYDEAISQIRGLRREQDVEGALNALVTSIRGMSYAQNGSNFGMNQLGELGGAMAYSGLKAVSYFMPGFTKTLRDIRLGSGAGEFAQLAERRAFGENIERRVFGQDYASRVYADATVEGSKLRYLDNVQSGINLAGKFVSYANFLPKLTDLMLRGIRQDALIDTVRWANGESVGLLRRPFSTSKLKAAGIKPENISKVQADIKKYLDFENKEFKMDEWLRESPDTYWRWKTLIDNQSQRAMVQNTVGNRAIVVNQSPYTKIFFQFKDFTLKTMNSQFMRAFTNREIDDVMSLMFSTATNAMVYSGLTVAKSYAYFGDNEGQRKQYLDRSLTFERIATAGLLRGIIGSGLSFGTDAYEALTGADTFRTSVSRMPQPITRQPQTPTPGEALGNVIAQLPAVRSTTDLGSSAYSGYKLAGKALGFNQKASQQDIKQLFRILPWQNSIPMIRFAEMLSQESGLPKKQIK